VPSVRRGRNKHCLGSREKKKKRLPLLSIPTNREVGVGPLFVEMNRLDRKPTLSQSKQTYETI